MRWRGDSLDAIERARSDRIDDVLRHVRQRSRFDPELRRALLASPTDALSNLRDIDPDDHRALRALDRDARERIAHALFPQALLTQTPGLPWWAVQSRPICPVGKSPALVYRAGSTRKMCQLSGQFDVQLSRPPNKPQMTASTSASSANVRAGDGGLSVQAGDYIYFFFNDVHPCDRSYGPNAGLQDAMAWTYAATSLAGKGPVLNFYTDLSFQSATVDAGFQAVEFTNVPWQIGGKVPDDAYCTAAAAFAKNPERNDSPIYLFYTQRQYTDQSGVLYQYPPVVGVSDRNSLPQFRFLYGFPSNLFSSGLCARTVYCPDWPGLPVQKGWGVLVWGTGPRPRRGGIHLAFCPLDKFEWNDGHGGTTAPWYFFAGLDSKGDPTWDISDANAKTVLEQVGDLGGGEFDSSFAEFSMMFEPTTQLWVTLYAGAACPSKYPACPSPGRWRGINVRYARAPWGPWLRPNTEDGALLLAPGDAPDDGRSEGYGDFIHRQNQADGLNDLYDEYYCGLCETDPNKPNVFATCSDDHPAGEYAPILVPAWCDATGAAVTLRWTLSTWRPYQTLLMESVLDIVCN